MSHEIFRFCCRFDKKLIRPGRTGPCTFHRPGERPHEAGCDYEWSYVDPHVKGNGQVRIGGVEGTDVVGICDVDLLP